MSVHDDAAELVEVIAAVLRDRYPAPPGTGTVGFRGDGRAIVAAMREQPDVVDRWLEASRG